MKKIERIIVDWRKTGKKLQMLRLDNMDLRRYVCFCLKTNREDCEGLNCAKCTYEMDHSISRKELSFVFSTSENVITNWEEGRSIPTIEDLLLYCSICHLDLMDVLVCLG